MSLLRSIINSASPPNGYAPAWSKSKKDPERELELPLYSNPPPSIPSPITKSIYKQPQHVVADLHASTLRLQSESQKSDDMLYLQRREQHLQQRLQELLDAQADGLVAGLAGQTDDESPRSGSSTPTAHSLRTPSRSTSSRRGWEDPRSPSRATKKLSLRYARKEIYRTIRQLSSLKAEEDAQFEAEQQDDESVLEQIDAWEQKRTRLERETADVQEHEGGQEVQALQSDADKLGGEIQDLEIRLAQMKTRHRQMLAEIEEVDNNVQSKLASYKASAAMLNKEIKSFLERSRGDDDDRSTFAQLPPNRRTLDLAKEHYHDRLNETEHLRSNGRMEQDALDEGAQVWKEVVESLTAFEAKLKVGMVALSKERDKEVISARAADIVQQMDGVLGDLQAKLDLARERDWKLLVVCIGAEVEAFRQGMEILEDLLPARQPPQPQPKANGTHEDQTPTSSHQLPPRNSPMKRSRIATPPTQRNAPQDSSDDDPDPELLITHQQDRDD